MNLLKANNKRFVLFPIQYPSLFKMYKKAVASFWTPEEIDTSSDLEDWDNKMNEYERDFILKILGFFAASDGVVIENLVENFCSEVKVPEARAFYGFQTAMENIHSETYSLLIDKFGADKKNELFNAIDNHPATKAKADWALKHISKEDIDPCTDFAKRLIAFACVEGIMFSSSFCAIFWLKNRGLCPGLCFSNELISRDEGLHRDFAIELYKLFPRLDRATVVDIVKSAVKVELTFVEDTLPKNLEGMNATLMKQYVYFVADHLVSSLGYKKEYNVSNPFEFMNMISLEGKTNFFEKRVGEYSKACVGDKQEDFNIDVQF